MFEGTASKLPNFVDEQWL